MHEFAVKAMVRGYHVYQAVWEVNVGEVLPYIREPGNQHDPHVVVVKKVISSLDTFHIRYILQLLNLSTMKRTGFINYFYKQTFSLFP